MEITTIAYKGKSYQCNCYSADPDEGAVRAVAGAWRHYVEAVRKLHPGARTPQTSFAFSQALFGVNYSFRLATTVLAASNWSRSA